MTESNQTRLSPSITLAPNKLFKQLKHFLSTSAILLIFWQLLVWLFDLPDFILPPPAQVLTAIVEHHDMLFKHTLTTSIEICLGLVLGLLAGFFFALQMLLFRPVKKWLLPVLVISQAIPVFALAPILMLWLGYGIASKVAVTALIIFFPVTTCCYDGLSNTFISYIDLAQTMKATHWQILRYIRFPAALPALASGIRIAIVVAPIGAVAGEWVGSSEGLGYIMMQANARMYIDEMFAELFILSALSISLYSCVNWLLKRLIHWEGQQ